MEQGSGQFLTAQYFIEALDAQFPRSGLAGFRHKNVSVKFWRNKAVLDEKGLYFVQPLATAAKAQSC
jgi:hypothetical protein